MIGILALAACLAGAPIGLHNADFRDQAGGHAAGWEPVGAYRALPDGGRGGMPALELVCDGGQDAGAVQAVRLDPPRRGAFAVTARVRCDGVEEGGDCALWLDVLQAGGPPIWGAQGLPRRDSRQWQTVRAEVRPTHPVGEIRVYLLLRKVRGRVRFADVRVADLPFEVRSLRVFPAGGRAFEVRGALSDALPWRLRAAQGGRAVWQQAGDGATLSARFTAPGPGPVAVTLTAEQNGRAAARTVRAAPRQSPPAFDWWVADPFARVFLDDLPPERPASRVEIEAARNDRESFQVGVRPGGGPLRGLRAEVSDLVSPEGRIPAARVQWFRVGCVRVEQPFAHPYAERRAAAWWPDPLLPGVPCDVAAGDAQALWFTVHVPPGAAPGRYRGSVTLRADGAKPVEVPVALTVYPVAIPDRGHVKTAFALMDGFLKKVYGAISPPLRRAYTDYLLAHHLNPDDISRTSPPDLDELAYAARHGLNAFNILNVVPEPTRPVEWVCFAELAEYTPAFRERFFARLDAIVPELARRGLLDRAYIYGFDERGPEYIPVIRDLFGEIKRRYPQVRTVSTCWPPAGTDPLSLNVDCFVPLSSAYSPVLARSVRQRGGEMWWYVCMGPNYPYANWLLENPLVESRLIWWQVVQNGVEGFLYWGLNIWSRERNDRPIPDGAGPRLDWSNTTGGAYQWLNGDGMLLYPGERGPIGSLRMEHIRDGLEDAEILRLYGERFAAPALQRLIARVSQDRTHYLRDPRVLLAARREALRALR